MARKPDDWMPLRIGLYLADTTHLTRDQHGAYLLLLMGYWMRGGALPADDRQLATIAKCQMPEWKRMKAIIAAFFTERDGKWFQKRSEEELEKARKLLGAKSSGGKKGAETRWQKHGSANGTVIGLPIAERQDTVCQNDAPLPSTLPTEDQPSLRSGSATEPEIPKFLLREKVRKRRLPDGFEPNRENAIAYWTRKERADLCRDVEDQVTQFRAHHRKCGSQWEDWDSAWVTWYSKAPEMVRPRTVEQSPETLSLDELQTQRDRAAKIGAPTHKLDRAIAEKRCGQATA